MSGVSAFIKRYQGKVVKLAASVQITNLFQQRLKTLLEQIYYYLSPTRDFTQLNKQIYDIRNVILISGNSDSVFTKYIHL